MEPIKCPKFDCFLYKYFGIETKLYKKWWKYYSECIQLLLKTQKINTKNLVS